MYRFRRNFNCCKSYPCKNMGMTESEDYVPDSSHLGYPAIHCKSCGAYPPLVDTNTVAAVIDEKLVANFRQQLTGCKHCHPWFVYSAQPAVRKYGQTSAGHQRYYCQGCQKVYTATPVELTHTLAQVMQLTARSMKTSQILEQTGLAPKLYFQKIQKLGNILRTASRLAEQEALRRPQLALHTESKVVSFSGNKAIWVLATTEADSGYGLLVNHNLSLSGIPEEGTYQPAASSILPEPGVSSILEALTLRYQATMRRPHFEALSYGETSPVRGASYIQPALLAYAHFQLLRGFCDLSQHFHHYIEHESAIRGAALMACSEAIRDESAEVFFVYRHRNGGKDLPATGNNVGWWSDKWFGTEYGAWCPISYRRQYSMPFFLAEPYAATSLLDWLQVKLPQTLKSAANIDALTEIYRNLYNFCQHDNTGVTPAMRLGIADKVLNPEMLLQEAISRINAAQVAAD